MPNTLVRELIVVGRVLVIFVPFGIWWMYCLVTKIYEFSVMKSFGGAHIFFLVTAHLIMAALDPFLYLMSSRSIRLVVSEFIIRRLKPTTDVLGCTSSTL